MKVYAEPRANNSFTPAAEVGMERRGGCATPLTGFGRNDKIPLGDVCLSAWLCLFGREAGGVSSRFFSRKRVLL